MLPMSMVYYFIEDVAADSNGTNSCFSLCCLRHCYGCFVARVRFFYYNSTRRFTTYEESEERRVRLAENCAIALSFFSKRLSDLTNT